MRIEIQWNSLFPLSMPYVTTLQYREIFWQNGSLLYGSDTAKQEFFMRLQLCLQSLHKHDFISNQLLFYCWLTQQHFNFSVSFFKYTMRKCFFLQSLVMEHQPWSFFVSHYQIYQCQVVPNLKVCIVQWNLLILKEVGYNKTLLQEGNFTGPSCLYFFVFLPWYNEKPDIR